jgi:phage replication O-like protein O
MANPQADKGYTRIANEMLEALAGIRISGEARQCLDVILRKTYGWNKKEDTISLSQFCLLTKMVKSRVCCSLAKLRQMNIIITKKGNGSGNIYRFNKDFDTWKPLPKKVTVKRTITNNGNRRYQKRKSALPIMVHTKDTITKDTITKDTLCERETKPPLKQPKKRSQLGGRSSKPNPEVKEIQKYFYSAYKSAFNVAYVANFGKDGKIFEDLLKVIPLDNLKRLVDKYFSLPDEFVEGAGYTVGLFKVRVNRLQIEKKAQVVSDITKQNIANMQSWLKKGGGDVRQE